MTIRTPTVEEMDDVFMMGFDVWGEALSSSDYLNGCRNSSKYQKGHWHVLVVNDEIVSSLITYKNEFGLPKKCYGIGSVATPPACRNKGYASALVSEVVQKLEVAGGRAIYLFSDIDTGFYEKLGFEIVDIKSGCMVRRVDPLSALTQDAPSYF